MPGGRTLTLIVDWHSTQDANKMPMIWCGIHQWEYTTDHVVCPDFPTQIQCTSHHFHKAFRMALKTVLMCTALAKWLWWGAPGPNKDQPEDGHLPFLALYKLKLQVLDWRPCVVFLCKFQFASISSRMSTMCIVFIIQNSFRSMATNKGTVYLILRLPTELTQASSSIKHISVGLTFLFWFAPPFPRHHSRLLRFASPCLTSDT